jgi:hypothetical protein
MYLGRADMLCPPVVSGFVPIAVIGRELLNLLGVDSLVVRGTAVYGTFE